MGVQAGHRTPRARALRSIGWTLLALATAVLVALPATAQPALPTDNAYAVTVTAQPTTGTTESVEVCLDFTFTIRNDSQGPDSAAKAIAVTLTPAPDGWRYARQPESSYNLAAGSSATPTLTLCPIAETVREGRVAATLTATMEDGLPDQVGPNPQAQSTIQATYTEDSVLGFELPSGAIYILAGGLAALITVILLSQRRIRYGVTLVCPEAEKRVQPGRGTSFPVRIRNEGGERDVVHLRLDPLPPRWDSFVPITDLSLDPGEEQTVWISIRSPPESNEGERVTVRVTGTSSSAPNEQAILEMHATVATPPRGQRPPERSVLDDEPDDDIGDDTVIQPDFEEMDEPDERPVAVRRKKR